MCILLAVPSFMLEPPSIIWRHSKKPVAALKKHDAVLGYQGYQGLAVNDGISTEACIVYNT
jgi:hypothetical protein